MPTLISPSETGGMSFCHARSDYGTSWAWIELGSSHDWENGLPNIESNFRIHKNIILDFIMVNL